MEGGGLMAAVLPTKGNLMAAKRSRTLAQTGYELMDRKRNILVREMMELMDSASQLQREIDQVFSQAYAALARAHIELGLCDHIAEGVVPDDSLDIRWRSVMGVELPHIPDNSPSAPAGVQHGIYLPSLGRGVYPVPKGERPDPPDGGD